MGSRIQLAGTGTVTFYPFAVKTSREFGIERIGKVEDFGRCVSRGIGERHVDHEDGHRSKARRLRYLASRGAGRRPQNRYSALARGA